MHKRAYVVVQRPPSSRCALGRPPASERRDPRRGSVIKRFLGCCGSRSEQRWSRAARSEPKRGVEQRNSHPLGGAASSRGGPTERAARGGGTLHNTHALSNSRTRSATPAAQHTRPLMHREKGGRCTTHTLSQTREPARETRITIDITCSDVYLFCPPRFLVSKNLGKKSTYVRVERWESPPTFCSMRFSAFLGVGVGRQHPRENTTADADPDTR